MTQHPEYSIEPYTHAHDAGLAVMWNESDQQWPGSFTRGVPFTAERIADWMDKQTTLVRLIVKAPDGTIVGYGSLWDEPSQPGRSCYVDLLNVHPDHQARSLCRRMLTHMVDFATENGYSRMTLGTWAANLKAVPLYKKVGFYWKPNSNVSMENYIPTLRRLPILRNFFAQTDWYAAHARELQQSEDEQRHPKTGDMEVYISQWKAPNGARVEAVIDRKAQELTGLETDDFAVYAHVSSSKPAQGLTYPITWEITNKRNSPLTVQLEASGDEQVEIAHVQTLTLEPEETQTLTAQYRCAVAAPRLEISPWRPKPTPQIRTKLLLDGQELLLGSGLHYAPAVALNLHPNIPTLTPRLSQTVLVQIKNQLDRPIQGDLHIAEAPGLTTDWQTHGFSAAAEEFASVPLTLQSQVEGGAALSVFATFIAGDEEVSTAPALLPVLSRQVGSVIGLLHQPDPTKTEIYVDNDFFHFGANQRAGRMWLDNKAGVNWEVNFRETLGPPYTPSEFEQSDYNLTLHQESGRACVTFSVASTRFPGMTLGRDVIITASPVVQVRHWLRNDGAHTHACKIQATINLPDGFASNAQVAFVRRERLVTALANTLPEVEGDFPKRPEGLAEQWGAFSMHGQTHGVVWSADISEHDWRPWFFNLISAECAVSPQTRVDVSPLYLYCGPGDWRAVRRIWQQANGQTEQARLDTLAQPQGAGPQQVSLSPQPLLTLTGEATLQLIADNVRQQPINGQIFVMPPAGWSVEPTILTVDALQEGKTREATLHFASPAAPVGPAIGQVQLQTASFDAVQPFTILRLGDARQSVSITQTQAENQSLWMIDNERMRWQVAPTYHAGLISWQEAGCVVNHLHTAFPTDGEFDWMKPWFGGIRPTLGSEEGNWPGKLHRETFTTTAIEAIDTQGLAWQGVRLTTEIQGQKTLKGLRVEIEYLTVPGSNVIKAILRLVNETPIYRSDPWPGFMLYCQVDGVYNNAVLYGESPHSGPVHYKRSMAHQWVRMGHWAAVVNPTTGRALTVACPSHPESVTLLNAGERGGHLMVTQSPTLAPHSMNELVMYVALVDSLEVARGYRCLVK
ncbi:MAG: GNAT family N-acetyltransferase [Caldilineaceae bacterium]